VASWNFMRILFLYLCDAGTRVESLALIDV
jgi:hypothetical protein